MPSAFADACGVEGCCAAVGAHRTTQTAAIHAEWPSKCLIFLFLSRGVVAQPPRVPVELDRLYIPGGDLNARTAVEELDCEDEQILRPLPIQPTYHS